MDNIAAKNMLQSISTILSEPLMITVKCEKEDCGSVLNVEIPQALEASGPPQLVVRCASCESLLKVQLPADIYTRHKASQLEALRACQEKYKAIIPGPRPSGATSQQLDVGTPDQQLAVGSIAARTT